MSRAAGGEPPTLDDFRELLEGFKKLLRQSGRLLSMGDRMQAQLNVLNREIAAKEALYRSIFSHVSEGIFSTTSSGDLVEVNPAMARILGWESAESFVAAVPGLGALFVSPKDHESYLNVLAKHGRVERFEAALRRRDGGEVWIQLSVQRLHEEVVVCPDGKEVYVGVALDMTEQRRVMAELSHRANVDSLTELPNRRYFMEIFRRELRRSRHAQSPLAVMIADIDFFKRVNDTMGHDAGDAVLRKVAHCICGSVRDVDTCARLGGEEFVMLFPETEAKIALTAAERIRGAVEDCCCGGARCPLVTVSIGVCAWTPDLLHEELEHAEDTKEADPDVLLKWADVALYEAKRSGRNRVCLYDGPFVACGGLQSAAPVSHNSGIKG